MRGWIILAVIAGIILAVTLLAPRVGATGRHRPLPSAVCGQGEHVGNPHCATPTPTVNPCIQTFAAYDYPQLQVPCGTPSASPSATPEVTVIPSATPSVTITPESTDRPVEGKDPPEKSSPCYYIQTSDECKSKSEVFVGESKTFGPQK